MLEFLKSKKTQEGGRDQTLQKEGAPLIFMQINRGFYHVRARSFPRSLVPQPQL